MKKKILLIGLLTLFVALASLGGSHLYRTIQKQSQDPVSMIIASDTHYLSPEYRGEYFKEPSAIFDGKLTHYSPEYFDAFLAEVIEKHPQVLILSGDITLNGSIKSHKEVVEKLKHVQAAGIDVLVIDHHQAEKLSEYACVVNNQLCNYPTKSLSGVGLYIKCVNI